MNPDFWRGRRVFLTGHTGFKGSWLALLLKRLGAHVTGYSLAPTQQSLYEVASVARDLTSVEADIRDFDRLSSALQRFAPEIVIHMAAQALVRRSYAKPLETYATNVMGTAHLLEAARGSSVTRVIVVVTSDKCYDNRESVWGYRETEPLGGYDPYSSSKACAELVTQAYRNSFFPTPAAALATARAGNVIGGGDWAEDRLVPDMVRAFSGGRKVNIRNPGAIRPWQHVLDPLAGYLLLAERMYEAPAEYSGAWNFGPADEDARPVAWVAAETCRQWGPNAQWERDESLQPHEAHYLKLDCSKSRQILGWLPQLRAVDALEWTVAWYKAFYAVPGNARQVTEQQIERYLEH